ncbi:MAG: ABC transporter substrate-binding protein [Oscillospiraceae bacterium]|nr:ABC transporter substrate-binding protein [Oscillospiraceae bacterium]
MKKLHIRLLSLILAFLTLAGCAQHKAEDPADNSEEPKQAEENPEPETPDEPSDEEDTGYSPADKLFSLCYDPAGSLNPLYGMNVTNEALMSLMFEGLFRIGADLEPEPVLCESWSTEDGISYVFKLKPNVYFHEGQILTAEDVVYSVNRAAGGSKYSSRFKNIRAITASDDLTVRIVLKETDYGFPALLDLPIIRSGTSDQSPPDGTGPYVFHSYDVSTYMTAFYMHRDFSALPVSRIYLTNVASYDLSRDFSARRIDLLDRDPLSVLDLNIHSDYETRYFETSNLIYLGLNTSKGAMRDPDVRRVIACLLDYQDLTEDYFRSAVTPAPLVLDPLLSYYDHSWEAELSVSPADFTELAIAASLQDTDNDGFWDVSGRLSNINITFIVNSENPYRLEAARAIHSTLSHQGFSVTLKELSYREYIAALQGGSFDIYLGEARLTPDFDLSAILGAGGEINYGHASGYDSLLAAIHSAPDTEAKREAARALCEYAAHDRAIIPIAYKRRAVFTHPGVVSGMDPSISGIFGNIGGWTIDL